MESTQKAQRFLQTMKQITQKKGKNKTVGPCVILNLFLFHSMDEWSFTALR